MEDYSYEYGQEGDQPSPVPLRSERQQRSWDLRDLTTRQTQRDRIRDFA